MFFSSSLLPGNIIEILRSSDKSSPKNCAIELLRECKNYNFGLNLTYCTSEDVKVSMEHYRLHRPEQWMQFIKNMFPNTSNTDQGGRNKIFLGGDGVKDGSRNF